MRGRRTLAIINPAAGKGLGDKLVATLAADLAGSGLSVDVVKTPAPGEAARLASHAVEDGYEQILAVGGDGTAMEVANGLVGTDATLALYPIGSGNDFSRALGYPRGRKRLGAFLAAARPRRIDVGEVNGRIFLNAAGVGIDGYVAERVLAASRVVGPTLGYFVGALHGIATFTPRQMRITIDGQVREGPHMMVAACNGTYFGSGMRVAPNAKLDDGLFDVIVGGDLSRRESVAALGKIYRGTHVNGRTIVALRAASVDVELPEPLTAQIDGEVEKTAGLRMRLRPRSLTVLAR
jgi:YegS/Rv2252/BmrU family lipid kinase